MNKNIIGFCLTLILFVAYANADMKTAEFKPKCTAAAIKYISAVAAVDGREMSKMALYGVTAKVVYYDADMRSSIEETHMYGGGESGYSATLDAGSNCRLVTLQTLSEG